MPKGLNEPNQNLAVQLSPQSSRALQTAYLPPPMTLEPEADDSGIPLSQYLWIVRRHTWKILLFVLACVVTTFVVSSRMQPVYEATATLDIDRSAPTGVLGRDSDRGFAGYDQDQFLLTQVRMLQSDAVLRPVAIKHRLLEKEGQTLNLATDRREAVERAPITLGRLRVNRPPNTFLVQVSYRSTDPSLAADVANGVARSYLDHTINLRVGQQAKAGEFMTTQLEDLKAKMEKSSDRVAQFERAMGFMNAEDKTSVMSSQLLQLSKEYTDAQADRVKKEAIFNSTKSGSVESVQNAEQGRDLLRLEEKLKEAGSRFAEVRATYGANHPEYRRRSSEIEEMKRQVDESRKNIAERVASDYRQASDREDMLRKAVGNIKGQYDALMSRSADYQRMKSDAESDKKLYEELIRKVRESSINSQFQSNYAKMSDQARPPARPVLPNVPLNVALALVLSSILALGAAVLYDVLDTTVRDPEQASRFLKTDVIGTLPAVKNTSGDPLIALTASADNTRENSLIKVDSKGSYGYGYGYKSISSYEEAVRTLRNTILLSDLERNIHSLLVTSASPGEGKTTTAVHLAIAHAQQGKKTLIIDADLRRPTVHKKLNMTMDQGLSNVLIGEREWNEVLLQVPNVPDLMLLPSGPPSRRASDLIGPLMTELLDRATQEFDLVIVDAPPLLGFAEPLQIATIADAVVVVTRAGETKRAAVANVLSTLKRLHANVIGLVLNQVRKEMSDHYYYYGHYRKYYGHDADKAS